jgi:4'-phosphopantetheinyl transferase superfamily
VHVGIDVAGIDEWRARLARVPSLADVAFTPAERRYLDSGDPAAPALVWAGKEAVGKLLRTGFSGLGWRGIEVVPCPDTPGVWARARLHGVAVSPVGSLPTFGGTALVRSGRVVVLVACSGVDRTRLAVQALPLPRQLSRPDRRRQSHLAVRRAAGLALSRLSGSDEELQWDRTSEGAPIPRVTQGLGPFAASLSHGSELAMAVIAAGDASCTLAEPSYLIKNQPDRSSQPCGFSVYLTISEDVDLRRALLCSGVDEVGGR